ncbi:hypothetical protein [Phytohabitans flavus]|uniref:hypothetical protein n=1 Tax=Phytohabitans flavus TaxID=1076124 RepID=UPI001E3310C5|nr:hypothetical protein [Phytohabitans flavus]
MSGSSSGAGPAVGGEPVGSTGVGVQPVGDGDDALAAGTIPPPLARPFTVPAACSLAGGPPCPLWPCLPGLAPPTVRPSARRAESLAGVRPSADEAPTGWPPAMVIARLVSIAPRSTTRRLSPRIK